MKSVTFSLSNRGKKTATFYVNYISCSENRVTKPYEIRDICGTKAEAPHLTEEERNAILEAERENPDLIEQVVAVK